MALITVAEERRQQKEDIEDIQEDRRREQRCRPDVSERFETALEVVRRQACEDHETDHGVISELCGIWTKIATIPKAINAISAQKRARTIPERSRRVA
mgnify:CR=1 FL=1